MTSRAAGWLRANFAETGFAFALLLGWALFVHGLALALGRWVPGVEAIGWGLFLLVAGCGWSMLRTIAVVGLYNLRNGSDKQ